MQKRLQEKQNAKTDSTNLPSASARALQSLMQQKVTIKNRLCTNDSDEKMTTTPCNPMDKRFALTPRSKTHMNANPVAQRQAS